MSPERAQKTVVLFEEDFSALPVAVIGGDYTPAGEYHVPPEMADTGRWRETVVHYRFRQISAGNWQVVRETDGRHVLEQTCRAPVGPPMLAAGEPYWWREVTVEAGLRPLTEEGWRAIVFRYRHARRFYAAAFSAGMLRVLRRDNGEDTVLGEIACALDPDRYTRVTIECEGPRVRVSIEGEEALRCADTSLGAFDRGGVAFAADDVTRYRDLEVTAPRPAAEAARKELDSERDAEQRLRARHPRPVLWRKIRTPRFGTDRNLRAGDIDGDGVPELVLARRTNRHGGDDYASITSLAAYDLEGRSLWTSGEPGSTRGHTTCDLCFQIHDQDGDGRAEVWFCRDFELCVADGATGQVRRALPLPKPVRKEGYPRCLYRIMGDAIFFCDLTGNGRPDSFLLKDRYKNAWAYDKDFRSLWQFSGTLAHFPFARDVDGDGRDEVAMGYDLLDHDGTRRWTVNFNEHADNVAIVDLRDGGPNAPAAPRVLIAGSDAGFYILDLEGRVLMSYPIGHAQGLCVGNLLPERDGIEILVNTFWGAAGITAAFDEAGRMLREFEPMPYACLLQPVNWVPRNEGAKPADLVLLSTHPRQGGLMDALGRRAVMFPDDGHPTLCSDARDLDGDGLDEILTWDEDAIWIYKADTVAGRDPSNYPQRNPWYNDSNYRAQISLPRA